MIIRVLENAGFRENILKEMIENLVTFMTSIKTLEVSTAETVKYETTCPMGESSLCNLIKNTIVVSGHSSQLIDINMLEFFKSDMICL